MIILSYCLHDFAVGHLDETSFLNATDIPDTVLRNLQKGGTYKPLDCLPRERTAIIIPYRDKEKTLKVSWHTYKDSTPSIFSTKHQNYDDTSKS